jgi:hypothetical protein
VQARVTAVRNLSPPKPGTRGGLGRGRRALAQIARALNTAGTPAADGGMRWWPSTVRAVLDRIAT